jgi:hypothetical protein
VSFNAPNFLITKVVLENKFTNELEPKPPIAAPASVPSQETPPQVAGEPVASIVSREIDKYSILSGFLSGTWGLVLPFVVEGQIRDLIEDKGTPQTVGTSVNASGSGSTPSGSG